MRLPGFIGGTYENLSRSADAQKTVNLYPEKIESGTGKNDMVLQACPGKKVWATLPDTPIRALFEQDGRAFAVAGFGFYELLANNSFTLRGAVASDDQLAAIASNGAGGNQALIVSGGNGYSFNFATSALAGIGGGFPAQARFAQFLDGYFLTTAQNFVYASNLEDGTTWSAASKATRNISSDNIVTIAVDDHRILWVIGSKTSEPWYDGALTPFAFTPVPGAFMGMGTGSPYTIKKFDNSVCSIGQNEAGGRMAFRVGSGYQPDRLSTHAIETAWAAYAQVDDAYVWPYEENGHIFSVFTFPSADASWAFDSATSLWHERGRWNSAARMFDADDGSCHCYAFGKHLVGSRSSGVIYEQAQGIYDDNGTPKRWLRRSPHLSNDNTWTYERRFELAINAGDGLITGQGSAPIVNYRNSDDGGRTWGPERQGSMGQQGAYTTQLQWVMNGRFRDRVREVSGSDPVKTCLIDAFVDVEAGAF